MRKLLFALAAVLLLAGCKKEEAPEYSTPPEFGEAVMYPVDGEIKPTDIVSVTVKLQSLYGLQVAWISYYINGDKSTTKNTSSEECYNATLIHYKGYLPPQKFDTKVTYRVMAYTPYGVLGYSPEYSYTVSDEITPLE